MVTHRKDTYKPSRPKDSSPNVATHRRFSSADYLRKLMVELDRGEICRRIAAAREEAGLTQPELADAISPPVHWRTVQTWERGETDKKTGAHRWTVPWKSLGQIAEITGKTKEWFLHGSRTPAAAGDEVSDRLARIEQVLEELVARLSPGEQEAQGQ